MNDFDNKIKEKIEYVENIVYKYCPKEEGKQKIIIEAMNYSVKAGGKRLRPMLMLETLRLFDGSEEEAYPFMAAIEMIHTYSLVHDDLPAMDNDDYRRGNWTTHKKYGEDLGVLAGDGLLNYAYEIMSKAVVLCKDKERSAKAMAVISEKAGIYGMVGGQTVDVISEGKPIDLDTIEFIHCLKTAALIEASMMTGAILAGASDSQVSVVEKIAYNVGIAFQIQDDILDITGNEDVLGKPVLSDEKNNKTTYVTIKGIKDSKKVVEDYSNEAISLLKGLGRENLFLEELILRLINREK